MLNREKLAKDIFSIVSKLFPELGDENQLAQGKWDEIAHDELFAHRVEAAQSSFLVPRWQGNLTDVFSIEPNLKNYTVIAVDGSQIYPDRHVSGAGCFLINTGGVVLSYTAGAAGSCAKFFSEPRVMLPEDFTNHFSHTSFSRDFVDLKREEFEFDYTVKKVFECLEQDKVRPSTGGFNPLCFVDGSIIFWQLESKQPEVKKFFLNKYLAALEALYKERVLVAGYISMPKSRELVSLIKLGLCRFTVADCISCHREYESFTCKQVDRMLDTHVARFFLEPFQRTTVFYSTSKVVEDYPDHLRPAFVYCDVGSEIVRLEVPTWIAEDEAALNYICSAAIDQSKKGRGYPVCLAEAHEQAVVKGGDREFFYHLLCKVGMDYKKRIRLSQKAIKKRGIGV